MPFGVTGVEKAGILLFLMGVITRIPMRNSFQIHQIAKRTSSHSTMTLNSPNVFAGNNLVYTMDIPDVDGIRRKLNYLDSGGNLEPLVILIGTAQTVTTWSPHVRPFMKSRRVIIPELRCQGIDTELLTNSSSIGQHLIDLENILYTLKLDKVDLLGFSFGGRVGIAFAGTRPGMVSKLSVTGVPLQRSFLGAAILQSWREGLASNNLRECAWSFLLNGYSEEFIEKNYHRLPTYVDMICASNSAERLFDLMTSCHIESNDDPFSVSSFTSKLICPIQIIASKNDRISNLSSVYDLHTAIPHSSLEIIDKCGHLLPFENPLEWRRTTVYYILSKFTMQGLEHQLSKLHKSARHNLELTWTSPHWYIITILGSRHELHISQFHSSRADFNVTLRLSCSKISFSLRLADDGLPRVADTHYAYYCTVWTSTFSTKD
eukprot:gene9832-20450_t